MSKIFGFVIDEDKGGTGLGIFRSLVLDMLGLRCLLDIQLEILSKKLGRQVWSEGEHNPIPLKWAWGRLHSIKCGVRACKQITNSKQSLSDLSPEMQDTKSQLTWFQ